MLDGYDRNIDYLRISVTDRCNLNCFYCMPFGWTEFVDAKQIMNKDEIVQVAKTAIKLGFNKIRLTGGEPLIREDILEIIKSMRALSTDLEICLTTNGILLDEKAVQLKNVGLDRVNISLDAIDESEYKRVTHHGDVKKVIKGIYCAEKAGFETIKINCVVNKSSEESNALDVLDFCNKNGYQVRFIRLMNLAEGKFWKVEGGLGGDCPRCNRIRVSCDGKIFPCLFSDISYDMRELGIENAITKSICNKPEKGSISTQKSFSRIGG